MNNLPTEIWMLIAEYLTHQEFVALNTCSKSINRLLNFQHIMKYSVYCSTTARHDTITQTHNLSYKWDKYLFFSRTRSFGLIVDNREALQKALSKSLVDSISLSFNRYSNLFQSYKYSQGDLETLIRSLNETHDTNIVPSILTDNLNGIYNWESIICSAVRSNSDTVIQLVLDYCTSFKPELPYLDQEIFNIESFNLDQLKILLKADLFRLDSNLTNRAIQTNKLDILQYCIDSGVSLVDPDKLYYTRDAIKIAIENKYIKLLRYVIQHAGLSDPQTKQLLTTTAVGFCPDILADLWKAGLLLLPPRYTFNLHTPTEFDPFPLVGFRTVSKLYQSDDSLADDGHYPNYSRSIQDICICVDLVASQMPNNAYTFEQLMKLYIISGNVSKFEDLLDSSDILSTGSDQFWSECWSEIGRAHHYPFANNVQMLKLLLKNNIVGPDNYMYTLAIDGEDFELIEMMIRHSLVGYQKAFQIMDKCMRSNRQDLLPFLFKIPKLYDAYMLGFDKNHLWFWKQKIETKALTEDEVEYFRRNGLRLGLEEIVDAMVSIGYFTWEELMEDINESDEWWISGFISDTTVDVLIKIREHIGELNLNALDDGGYRTACEKTIRNGNLEVLKYILASEDFDGLDSDCIIGMITHECMLEYFFFDCDIEYRASIPEADYKLVRVACQKGYSTFIRRVIDELKPDVQFYNNLSPIYLAIQFGHLSIVQMIIEEAMKLGITDTLFDPNQSLIEVACIFNQHSVLEYILKLGKIDINANGGFALVSSCLEGSAECLQLLLNDPQCDISNLPTNICTKMMKINKNAECLRVLFNDGRFDWIDWKELLRQSCLLGNAPYVEYILENDIVDPNVDNQEAFQLAFTSGFYPIVTLFLNHSEFKITSIPNH
ncbi:hypothetical protein BC833DRAFT_625617 [Globomyces pollinis-pini]|nr:hypothetical protein BC833DRAFT_625617 [Globomyces pollinis-pini]